MKEISAILTILISLALSSCVDDQSQNPIPAGYLQDMWIDLTDIENAHLKSKGNSRVYTGNGYGGVLVYYTTSGDYCAYDAACPHEASRDTYVSTNSSEDDSSTYDFDWIDGTESEATCIECGSTYDLIFGTGGVTGGKSVDPLRSYKAVRSGDYLKVYSVD